jgi:hypothetical protein
MSFRSLRRLLKFGALAMAEALVLLDLFAVCAACVFTGALLIGVW